MRAFWLALLATTAWVSPASAEPISASIAIAIGFTAGTTAFAVATTVITGVLTTALSVGVGYLSQALSTKQKPMSGTASQVQFGGDVPRQVPIGECKLGGQLIYYCGVGEKNKELHLVYALADWECDSLSAVVINGEKKALNAGTPVGTEHLRYAVSGYSGKFEVAFFRGTMTQTADSELVAASAARSTGVGDWTSNHRGAGICYLRMKLTWDEDLFQGGIPRCEWILKGAKLYDRRKDSTAGGSGAHRWNDVTTWEYSDNPVIADENFRRGFFRNGQRLVGMAMPASALLDDHYVAAANICDEALTEGGVGEKRYICSVIVNDDAEWKIAVDAFQTAYAGEVYEKYGKFGPIAGAAQSVVGTFSAGELSRDHPSTFSKKLPRQEMINQVYGSFINPAKNYENDAFAPVTDSGWLAEDNGEPRAQDAQLLMVPRRYQANRIAQIIAKKGRMQARHTGVYGPTKAKFEPGDWVTVSNRFGDTTMVIERKERIDHLVYKFYFREIAASVYGGTGSVVTPPTVVEVSIPPHQTSFSGSVTPVSVIGALGQIIPGIRINWTPPPDPTVTAVRFEYRVAGTVPAVPVIHMSPADGQFLIYPLLAGTDYEVRARYQLDPDLTSAWSSWVTVKTTSAYVVANSKNAIDSQNIFDRAEIEAATKDWAELLEAMQGFQTEEGIRFQFNKQIAQVQATVNSSYAAVTVVTQALASEFSAFASQLTVVEAKADGASAQGLFKMQAEAATGGAMAQIAAFVSADNGLSHARAGWALQAYDDGGTIKGRMLIEASEFAINVAGVAVTPFSVIGADTYINRVVVNDEILSDNFDEDTDGNPIEGFRLGSDGIAKIYDGRFFDMQTKGASFTDRPIKTAAPIFRNGVMEGTPLQYYQASTNRSGGGISWPFDPDTRFLNAEFHRSPDACYLKGAGTAKNGSAALGSAQLMYPVPTGQLLPTRMIMEASGLSDYAEFRQDGTLRYIVLDGNGGISSDNAFGCKWMSDLEIDPENRRGLTTIVGSLGITRGALPFVVPEAYSYLRIALLGAGGGYDDSNGSVRGGPGGYYIFDLPIGWAAKVKPGDTLWFVIGEGGGPYRTGNTQGYGGGGQGDGNRAQGGGGTFCFHKEHSSRTSIIAVAGGGGGGEGSASGGPGGLTTSTNPSGGQSSGGDTMARCTGKNWDWTGSLKRGAGGGGYEGGITGGASGSNRGGRGGSSYANIAGFNLTNTSQAASGAGADGQATTNARPAAATTKFSGFTTCLGTTFDAGEGADNGMSGFEKAGDGLVMIELIP